MSVKCCRKLDYTILNFLSQHTQSPWLKRNKKKHYSLIS